MLLGATGAGTVLKEFFKGVSKAAKRASNSSEQNCYEQESRDGKDYGCGGGKDGCSGTGEAKECPPKKSDIWVEPPSGGGGCPSPGDTTGTNRDGFFCGLFIGFSSFIDVNQAAANFQQSINTSYPPLLLHLAAAQKAVMADVQAAGSLESLELPGLATPAQSPRRNPRAPR